MTVVDDIVFVTQPSNYTFKSADGLGASGPAFYTQAGWGFQLNWNHAGDHVAGLDNGGALTYIDLSTDTATVLSNVPTGVGLGGGIDFTPDDSKIIVPYDNGVNAGFTLVNVSGSGHTEHSLGATGLATITADGLTGIAVSPDGTLVAYMTRGTIGKYSIAYATIGGASPTVVLDGTTGHPVFLLDWYSDSLNLLIMRQNDPTTGKFTLYKSDLSGSLTSIFADTGSVLVNNNGSCALSPDNTKIALWNGSTSEIEVMASTGGTRTAVYGPDTDTLDCLDWGTSAFSSGGGGTGLSPTGIASEEAFGLPSLLGRGSDELLLPTAIGTSEAFGAAAIADSGPFTIHPTGIPAP